MDYFSGTFRKKLDLVFHSLMSPFEKVKIKIALLNQMRYLGYRFKSLSSHIADLVSLQACFQINEDVSFTKIDEILSSMSLERFFCRCGVTVYLSSNLARDEGLLNLFLKSKVNSSRSLAESILIIVQKRQNLLAPEMPNAPDAVEEIISSLFIPTPSSIMILAHSTVDLQVTVSILSKESYLKEILYFDPVRARRESLTFVPLVNRLEQSLSDFALIISDLISSNTYEEKLAADAEPFLIDEGSRACLVAASFVFQHMLDARRNSPTLQTVFQKIMTSGLTWVALELSLYAKGEDVEWVSFFLIKTTELMNSIMVRNVFDPFNWVQMIDAIEANLEPILCLRPIPEEQAKQAYIVDQCQTLLRLFHRCNTGGERMRQSVGKFPDQLILEERSFYILSMLKCKNFDEYKCLNLISRKIVDVKRFSKNHFRRKSARKTEIDLMKGLKHCNIVNALDNFETKTHSFLVLENCESGLVSTKKGKIPELEIREIGRQILHGLSYLHSHHIVHGNLNRNCIKRTGLGFIKIGEFSDAQMTDPVIEERQMDFCSLSNISPYMAPECILQLNIDTPSDIWSFGCIIGDLISGEEPWSTSPENSSVLYLLASSNRPPFNIESLSCSVEGKEMLRSIFASDAVERPSATELLKLRYFSDLPYSVI